jgi:HK97 family phage major capsid protein
MNPIEVLNTRRDELQAELDKLLETPTAEKRNLNDDEDAKFEELAGEIRKVDDRVAELADLAKRQEAAAEVRRLAGQTTAKVTEPDIYIRGNGNGNSYFRDLARAKVFDDSQAADRLRRTAVFESEKRALGNTGAAGGSGGEFAPPAWIIDDWINIIRAGRVTANLFRHEDVPVGVSSINYPRVTGGTTTAIQTTQNTALSQTDMTTAYVQTGFATIGGKQIASQQLLDQTALNFDRVILSDLAADYALRVGTQIFLGTGTGSGTGAVVNGLSAATIGSTQTWTQASPTPGGFYGQAGGLLSQFLGRRLAPPDCWVMAPRRWYWLASATDTAGRPLVVPTAGGAQALNPIGVQTDAANPTGMVGYFHGLPVYIDPLVPVNTGAGTNQDVVYLLKLDDLVLFESQPRAEVFRETYADSVGVLFRMYGYVGTILNRHTESLGVISGTGLVTPVFAS